MHDLLVCISQEVETIQELCRRDEVRDRMDAVLAVLKRVAASIDQIMEILDGIERKMQNGSESRPNANENQCMFNGE